jgi:hypothetical protein
MCGANLKSQAVDLRDKRTVCIKRMIIRDDKSAKNVANAEILLMNTMKGKPFIVDFYGGGFSTVGTITRVFV